MTPALLLPAIVAGPLLAFAVIAIPSFRSDGRLPEDHVARAAKLGVLVSTLATAGALAATASSPTHELVFGLAPWLEMPGRQPTLVLDELSAPFLALTVVLSSIVASFSASYLHRERGYARFFLLFSLFVAGMALLCLAGSLNLFFIGWELVGLTSTLLIAFFHERAAPVRHGLRAFAVYRACDVGLLVAVLLEKNEAATGAAHDAFAFSGAHATIVGVFLVLAAMGKSAQVPLGGWLPRAMEGPTPSSAIFYGALSVHSGLYLLARTSPWMADLVGVRILIGGVGAATALYGALLARVQTDIKSGLAYATMTQVGVMFVEVAAGYPRLALLHMVGHACLRTWQLLRAPAIVQDVHEMRDALRGPLPRVGAHWERLLSPRLRARLHASALQGFFLDDHVDAIVVRPLFGLARVAVALEAAWTSILLGRGEGRAPGLASREIEGELGSRTEVGE
ncbi:MAG: proton-conducting membrane transporter [Labilithrix sp.]|nr:proton-conducting membrane transporter [Labilithrix sp.]